MPNSLVTMGGFSKRGGITMQLKKNLKYTVMGAAFAVASFGAAHALPAPVDAVWKNDESTAAQIIAAMKSASADKSDLADMALEVVEASRPLAQTKPRIAVKGAIAACQAGSDPEVVEAAPDTADAIASACRDAAKQYKDQGIATPAQVAMMNQAADRISPLPGEGTPAGNQPEEKPGQGKGKGRGFEDDGPGESPNQDVPPKDRGKGHSPG